MKLDTIATYSKEYNTQHFSITISSEGYEESHIGANLSIDAGEEEIENLPHHLIAKLIREFKEDFTNRMWNTYTDQQAYKDTRR